MNRPVSSRETHGASASSVDPSLVGGGSAGAGGESAGVEVAPELEELRHAIDGLDVGTRLMLQPLFHRVSESVNRRRKILQMVQESIGQLRLDMKYLVFDLEATRRERDDLELQVGKMMGEEGFEGDIEGGELGNGGMGGEDPMG